MRTAVIIPFFQRESGLLCNAVRSVLADAAADCAEIIVIDDGSPVSARSELSALAPQDGARVRLVEQPNSGPAAARNRGLASLGTGTELVAFLDSDDVWQNRHLERAILAFRAGADIYFADHQRAGDAASRFGECGLRPDGHEALGTYGDLYWYRGDLFDAILKRSPVGTSTMMYRHAVAPELRFCDTLHGSEDTYFWLALAARSRLAIFSTRIEAAYGRGVNIFAAAVWGTPAALTRIFNSAKMHDLVARTYPLTPEQRQWNSWWERELRRDFARNLAHSVRHRKPVDWRMVAEYVRLKPRIIVDGAHAVLARR